MSLSKENSTEHYIVAIGGSAGSLEPLIAFFDHTPLDSAAYIILRHLPKDSQSQLKLLLDRHSQLSIIEVAGSTPVEANNVYIAPSYKHLIIEDQRLHLVERPTGPNRSIDLFFHSLAKGGLGEKPLQ